MPFSSKAREIHDHIVISGKADHWIGLARSLVEGQRQPSKPYSRNIPALRDKLKAELSGAVTTPTIITGKRLRTGWFMKRDLS